MDLSVSLTGIDRGIKTFNQSVKSISGSKTSNLEKASIEQSKAKVIIGANIAVLKTAMELQESIIDLMA